jgi:hypothetical protein
MDRMSLLAPLDEVSLLLVFLFSADFSFPFPLEAVFFRGLKNSDVLDVLGFLVGPSLMLITKSY